MQGGFCIGEWHVQPQINCVQRDDTSIHLEPKVMQVLVLLAANQGEVISKERLLQTVWSGVFVGDDVLTRSISEIRRVLADDARAPHVIQTIPKTGYRLIASVSFDSQVDPQALKEFVAQPALVTIVSDPESAGTSSIVHSTTEAAESGIDPAIRQRRLLFAILIMIMCALLGGTLFWFFKPESKTKDLRAAYKTVPFTSYPGSEGQPAFSPDGNQIAFVWNGRNAENKNIYVKIVGTATPLRLTTDPADDLSPTWSPDGRFIAFVRRSKNQSSIDIVPAIGGAERKVYTLSDMTSWEYGGLAWSGDGKYLIFPDRLSLADPSALFSLFLDTLKVKRLTTPPKSWDGDWTPVVSPDGSKIAFLRDPGSAARDVYVMDASGGVPRRLTSDGRLILGLTWTKDGRNVVFSSNRDGGFSLWEVPVSGGTPVRLEVGGENAYSPAISHHGSLLAYSHGTGKWDIVRVDLRSSARKIITDQILSSNEEDSAPQFSPDGTEIAFQSWRSGAQEIWICAADGSGLAQVTSFGGALTGSPHWSPNGHRIAFDSRPNGRAHIYVVAPDGGVPHPLTSGDYNDIVPSWSPDGKWVFFGSNRSGSWEIWKVLAAGGSPRRVTASGGMIALVAPDGQWIYYTKSGMAGLWRISIAGGPEQQVLKDPPNGFQGYWDITKDGIYYLDAEGTQSSIDFVPFSAPDRVTRVHLLDHVPTPLSGLSVSSDGRWLIYADMAEASSNITLVENFH